MIVETVQQMLIAAPTVAAIIDDRAYPVQLPDASTFPALVISKSAGLGNYDMQGDVGVEEARIQIDCYAEGAANVIVLKREVRRVLSGFYNGGLASGDACAIQASFCINDSDLTDPATERAGPRLRRRLLEFKIWNSEV